MIVIASILEFILIVLNLYMWVVISAAIITIHIYKLSTIEINSKIDAITIIYTP